MGNYTATVIKMGNSYALRVPKAYVEQAKLKLGQKIQIDLPLVVPVRQNRKAVQQAIKNLQQIGAFRTIKDPVAWEREIRQDRPLPGRD